MHAPESSETTILMQSRASRQQEKTAAVLPSPPTWDPHEIRNKPSRHRL